MTTEELRLQTFGPDKILGPEHAEHVQGVVIRAINLHADLGIVRERIADAVAEALTGKNMRAPQRNTPEHSPEHSTPASPPPSVSAEQLEALIASGREHGRLYTVAALTELKAFRAMSTVPAVSNPYAEHDLEVARHTLRGLKDHLGKQDSTILERGLNAAAESLPHAAVQPLTFIDLRTGQPVEEDATWCPDCKRLAEEDGDILPPACAAHGGPPGGPHGEH